MSWDGQDPEAFFEIWDKGEWPTGKPLPWAPVSEHSIAFLPAGVAFVESLMRRRGPNGQTNPIHIVCAAKHETGLSVACGIRDGALVMHFRSKDHADSLRSAGVFVLDAFGQKGRGTADRSTGWRLHCPFCSEAGGSSVKSPSWVAEEAVKCLARGRETYLATGQWPRLRLKWT